MFYNYVKDLIVNTKKVLNNNLPFAGTSKNFLQNIPKSYRGLRVSASFGKGNWAVIPWIAFCADGQKVQNGIYPVFLYYSDVDVLILAYGVSATNSPFKNWDLNKPMTVGQYFKNKGIRTKNKYDSSYVFKVYETSNIGEELDSDLDCLVDYYKAQFDSTNQANMGKQSASTLANINTAIDFVIDTIRKSGLLYSDTLVRRYVISLLTKPFVILSGLAGSGKTQLALAFAKAICEDVQKQVRIVPVGADWTNRDPLLGYPNALESGKYVRPESGVLQLIQDAIEDETRPYFLILDEMNLSYVERYFADFLSSLESHSPILLWDKNADGVPMSISLPRNFFIVGTINVDETTYMFSPKVLDRANVIEFKIDVSEMDFYLETAPIVDLDIIKGAIADVASDFVNAAKSLVETEFEGTHSLLLGFFKALKSVNAEFGYRTASEIGRFIALAHDLGNLPIEKAVDAAIVQKLLPKLHGSRKKLVPVLTTLWDMCDAGIVIELADEVPDQTQYPLTADKLLRMYRGAIDNGFTSFAEA